MQYRSIGGSELESDNLSLLFWQLAYETLFDIGELLIKSRNAFVAFPIREARL